MAAPNDIADELARAELDGSVSLMTLYITYLQTMEKVSDRRAALNAWMITLLNAVVALDISLPKISAALPANEFVVPLMGILTCEVWRLLLGSFSTLNAAKFKVIFDLEQRLGIHPFRVEQNYYKELGRTGFARLERKVPFVFITMFVVILGGRALGISAF